MLRARLPATHPQSKLEINDDDERAWSLALPCHGGLLPRVCVGYDRGVWVVPKLRRETNGPLGRCPGRRRAAPGELGAQGEHGDGALFPPEWRARQ